MTFIPAPNIVQLEMRATHWSQKVENRIMVDALIAPTPTIIQDIATIGWDWWEATYAPLLSTSVHLASAVATDMSLAEGVQFTYAPDTTTTGENNTGELPNECSLCVSLRTGTRGRSARGRFYTLSVSSDQTQDSNNVKTSYANDVANALQVLFNTLETAGYAAVIVSYVHNKVPRPGGPVYYPITSTLVVDTLIDSQKRRKPGVGA
jgi:hypothetical protein